MCVTFIHIPTAFSDFFLYELLHYLTFWKKSTIKLHFLIITINTLFTFNYILHLTYIFVSIYILTAYSICKNIITFLLHSRNREQFVLAIFLLNCIQSTISEIIKFRNVEIIYFKTWGLKNYAFNFEKNILYMSLYFSERYIWCLIPYDYS